MRREVLPLLAVAACPGCGGGEDASGARSKVSSTPPTATATAEPARSPEARFGTPVAVSAQANIFAAGRDEPPGPGGGGGGELPPAWSLPKGSRRVITLRSVSGRLTPFVHEVAEHGAGGSPERPSDIESFNGISGVRHDGRVLFLVGVFLTDAPPGAEAPPKLDMTRASRLRDVAPRMAQTFYVGRGRGLRIVAPSRATRLFLGFADARRRPGLGVVGLPGFYSNNRGELAVTLEIKRR